MTGDLYRLHDMHPGLVSDVDPFRKQTEVLIYFLDDGDNLVPRERTEPSGKIQDPSRSLLFGLLPPYRRPSGPLRGAVVELTAGLMGH